MYHKNEYTYFFKEVQVMNNRKTIIALLLFALIIVGMEFMQPKSVMGQTAAAPNVVAALLVKLGGFDKAVGAADVTIYVMGAPDVATALTKAVGSKMGAGKLTAVHSGSAAPTDKPSIVFVGAGSEVAAMAYTRANKVLSVTGDPALAQKGVTLGIAVGANGKPAVFLNLAGSQAEGCNWNPAITKIAKIIK